MQHIDAAATAAHNVELSILHGSTRGPANDGCSCTAPATLDEKGGAVCNDIPMFCASGTHKKCWTSRGHHLVYIYGVRPQSTPCGGNFHQVVWASTCLPLHCEAVGTLLGPPAKNKADVLQGESKGPSHTVTCQTSMAGSAALLARLWPQLHFLHCHHLPLTYSSCTNIWLLMCSILNSAGTAPPPEIIAGVLAGNSGAV